MPSPDQQWSEDETAGWEGGIRKSRQAGPEPLRQGMAPCRSTTQRTQPQGKAKRNRAGLRREDAARCSAEKLPPPQPPREHTAEHCFLRFAEKTNFGSPSAQPQVRSPAGQDSEGARARKSKNH